MAADAARTSVDMGDIKNLEPLSKRLNAATNELNQALQTIQDKLNAMAVGIEVWLVDRLEESDWNDITDTYNEPTGERQFFVQELGYGRFGDGWALIVRERRCVENSSGESTWYDSGAPDKPLLKAPRNIRIAAVPLIPKLIDEIERAATSALLRIEQAKKIADSLE